ncbi:MAG: GxxExxY protein, partial [bacterium]|nr:GxxExxY protein [bacterium]
ALAHELKHEEIAFEFEKSFHVEFDGENIGTVTADMYVGDRFLLKILADSDEVSGGARSELRAVLRAAELELGLIINFGQRRLKDGLVRVLNPDALRADDEEDYDEEEESDYAHSTEE